jgi:hypothetical protein
MNKFEINGIQVTKHTTTKQVEWTPRAKYTTVQTYTAVVEGGAVRAEYLADLRRYLAGDCGGFKGRVTLEGAELIQRKLGAEALVLVFDGRPRHSAYYRVAVGTLLQGSNVVDTKTLEQMRRVCEHELAPSKRFGETRVGYTIVDFLPSIEDFSTGWWR